ncbi:unnamed protein product [Auanema sp. JU1783]|nr:unnamed protein product [Auanema sp. JU1783]
MMYKYLWLLNTLILSVQSIEQRIGAKGHLTCRGIRQPGIFIQLYDEDSFFLLDADDLMGSANSDAFGTFCVKGTTYEFSTIEPYILVEHNCGYEGTNEKAKLVQFLSPHFISKGNRSYYIEHLGEIELLTKEAPVQKYERRNLVYKHVHRIHRDRINECLPLYVTYKEFFEKAVFPADSGAAHDLRDGVPLNNPISEMPTIQEKITKVSSQLDKDLLAIENSELLLEKIRDQEKHLMAELHDEEANFHHLQEEEKQKTLQEKSDENEDLVSQPQKTAHREEILSYHKPDVQLEDHMFPSSDLNELAFSDDKKMEKLDEILMSSLNDEYDPCAFRKKRFPHVPFRRNDPCYKHLRRPSH